MALVDWTAEQKQQFLTFQFSAQHKHYTTHYPQADFGVLELGGEPIGRLYIHETPQSIHILDIALIPEYCGRGIGGDLLAGILRQAASAGLPVSIHVEQNNPARRLYERLGFRQIEEKGLYLLLEFRAAKAETPQQTLEPQEVSVCP